MSSHVQLPEPASELLQATELVVHRWLRRLVTRHAPAAAGADGLLDAEAEQVIDVTAQRLLADLADLLAADVDAQALNPLTLFREATAPMTTLLDERGAAWPVREPFSISTFPDDTYGLVPASWDDIDPSLQGPGIGWGAWKAMTILMRRRDEGVR